MIQFDADKSMKLGHLVRTPVVKTPIKQKTPLIIEASFPRSPFRNLFSRRPERGLVAASLGLGTANS